MLEIEGVDHISDEMRAVLEDLWPELVHKVPPRINEFERCGANAVGMSVSGGDTSIHVRSNSSTGRKLSASAPVALCQSRPNAGRSKKARLFDHLVGAGE